MAVIVAIDHPLADRLDQQRIAKPSIRSRSEAIRLALRLGLLELEAVATADEAHAVLKRREGRVAR